MTAGETVSGVEDDSLVATAGGCCHSPLTSLTRICKTTWCYIVHYNIITWCITDDKTGFVLRYLQISKYVKCFHILSMVDLIRYDI